MIINSINNSKKLEVLGNGIRSIGFLAFGEEYLVTQPIVLLFNYQKRLAKICFRHECEKFEIYCGENSEKKCFDQFTDNRKLFVVDIESLRQSSIFLKTFVIEATLKITENSTIVLKGTFEVSAYF